MRISIELQPDLLNDDPWARGWGEALEWISKVVGDEVLVDDRLIRRR